VDSDSHSGRGGLMTAYLNQAHKLSGEYEEARMYSVKANDFVRDVVIHAKSCSHVRKRGGVGRYGQVHWKDFGTLADAEEYAGTWQRKGYALKCCSFCMR
jgi:hypothetical protein